MLTRTGLLEGVYYLYVDKYNKSIQDGAGSSTTSDWCCSALDAPTSGGNLYCKDKLWQKMVERH